MLCEGKQAFLPSSPLARKSIENLYYVIGREPTREPGAAPSSRKKFPRRAGDNGVSGIGNEKRRWPSFISGKIEAGKLWYGNSIHQYHESDMYIFLVHEARNTP